MDSFEQAFSATEQAADATIAAATALVKQARDLKREAQKGNIAAIKRLQGRLDTALAELGQTVNNSAPLWPFPEEQEEKYLREDYAAELIRVAAARGLQIREQDGRLISSPSIVRILASDRAVRIDKETGQHQLTSPHTLIRLISGVFRAGQFLQRLW